MRVLTCDFIFTFFVFKVDKMTVLSRNFSKYEWQDSLEKNKLLTIKYFIKWHTIQSKTPRVADQ